MVQRVLEFGGGSIIIRRFNIVKKEMRKKVETSENVGIRSGRRRIRK